MYIIRKIKEWQFPFFLCKWFFLKEMIFNLTNFLQQQAIYGAAVAKSLRDVACTYTPANQSQSSTNISEYDPCWSDDGNINRMDAYRIALAVFVVFVGPFAFFNVTKTKYLQLLTTLMRWLAFGIMVTLACIRLSRGTIYTPPVSQFSGVPNLFGVCVYSFMCHHSLPSLGT